MITPETETETALALVRERWTAMFPIEQELAQLASWAPPCFVRGVGVVARINLFDAKTYKGPSADLGIVSLARMGEPRDALNELVATLASRGVASALEAPLEVTLRLTPARYAEGMFAPDEATERRRRDALAAMDERFDAVAARMGEAYGLRLPRYLATFAAFWRSLDELSLSRRRGAPRLPGGRGPRERWGFTDP